MSTSTAIQDDPYVVLHDVPWEMYRKIDEALGRYRTRHTYDRGELEMRGTLYGVTWHDYQELLEALGDHNLKHTYDRGTLYMMSPRKDHDRVKTLIGRMIELMTFELDIDIQGIGSTTITSENVDRGFEPDEAYYIANELVVRDKELFEPDVDPPPDLVIEIDVTNSAEKRMPSFAAMGVPEVWRHTGDKLLFFVLNSDGKYDESRESHAFPFLAPDDIMTPLGKREGKSDNQVVREFLKVVREKVADADR
ncbi:MAG: Uma2 family endonuclease [Pirellulales bacterium]|nr:Uma2 family endonuclease [Pirellulales bacterium]